MRDSCTGSLALSIPNYLTTRHLEERTFSTLTDSTVIAQLHQDERRRKESDRDIDTGSIVYHVSTVQRKLSQRVSSAHAESSGDQYINIRK